MRRWLGLLIATLMGFGWSSTCGAEDYPARPISMIVPFPAGGATDTVARFLGEKMRAILGQPLIIENVAEDPRFARDVAESTKYVPTTLMATPVICDEEAIGVLEVLDPGPSPRSALTQLELLSLFGLQAAAALRLVQRSRAARSRLIMADGEFAELVEVVRVLDGLDGERRQAGLRLFGSMRTLLTS